MQRLRTRLILAFLVATILPLAATIWITTTLIDRSLSYATTGMDSVIEHAWVYEGSRVWMLAQDQYGDGPWDIDGTECIDPVVQTDEELGYDVLGCGSTEPEGNHYQVCGEICAECGEPDPLPFDP